MRKIQFRRGAYANLPSLDDGEAGWCEDQFTLYIGQDGTNYPAVPATSLSTLGLDADLTTLSVPANTTISAFGKTLVDDASASAALTTLGVSTFAKTTLDDTAAKNYRSTLGMQEYYPEDYGAVGDGVTDDSAAIQACFDAVIALTYRPRIVFKSAKYAFGTGLTINFAQGMHITGVGGYWTPSDAGYAQSVTTLYYTGTGTALTIDGTVNNATGFIMERIYLEGAGNAAKGLYVNGAAGLVFRDMTIGHFYGSNVYGLHLKATQLDSFYNVGFVDNNYGIYMEGGSNTTLRFYDCSWIANRSYDIYDTGSVDTQLYNPVFQQTLGVPLSIDITASSGLGAGFTIYNWYDEACSSTYAGYLIDVKGDSASEAAYYKGFRIYGGTHNGGGAAETGFCRIQYTTSTTIDGIRHTDITPKPLYVVTTSNINFKYYNWDPNLSDDYIQDGAAATMYWPKTHAGQAGGEMQYTIKACVDILQSNPAASREALIIHQDDEDQAFINFVGTAAASSATNVSTWTTAALNGFVKIEVGGTSKWLPYYNAPTS